MTEYCIILFGLLSVLRGTVGTPCLRDGGCVTLNSECHNNTCFCKLGYKQVDRTCGELQLASTLNSICHRSQYYETSSRVIKSHRLCLINNLKFFLLMYMSGQSQCKLSQPNPYCLTSKRQIAMCSKLHL